MSPTSRVLVALASLCDKLEKGDCFSEEIHKKAYELSCEQKNLADDCFSVPPDRRRQMEAQGEDLAAEMIGFLGSCDFPGLRSSHPTGNRLCEAGSEERADGQDKGKLGEITE